MSQGGGGGVPEIRGLGEASCLERGKPENYIYLSTLANSTLNYITFRNVDFFKNYFFQIKKYCE
jgi:hypothetical protein